MYFCLLLIEMCVSVLCQHLAPNRCFHWSQRAPREAVSEPLKRRQFTVYLSPRAVVTVRVKGHRLGLELLDDRATLVQQSCGHLVGAPAVCPPAVPAGGESAVSSTDTRTKVRSLSQDAWVLPVLHSDGRLSVQLFSGEAFSEQVDDLSLQAQPTTTLISSPTPRPVGVMLI